MPEGNRTLLLGFFPAGFQMTALVRRLRRSSFFLNLSSVAGANLVSKLIGLITLGYAARVLGPNNYGLLGFGASVVAYAGILISPGLLTWGARSIAQDRTKAGQFLIIINFSQLILASLTFAGLFLFTQYFLEDSVEKKIVLIYGLVLFQIALSVDWVFNGLELMRIPALLGVLSSTLGTIGLFTLIRSPDDLFIYPFIGYGVSVISYAVVYGLLYFKLKIGFSWPQPAQFKQALLASLPLGLMMALVVILHYANNLIVKAYLGSATLGIFLASYRLLELASTIPGILSSVFLPRLARVVANSGRNAQLEARYFAQVHMMIGFFIAAFMLAEAPAIIGLIYGQKYVAAVNLLRIMSVGVLFNFAIGGYTNCLISFGQDRVMILVVVVSAVVAVGGGFWLVPRIGALGAALVISSIDLCGWLVSLPFYREKIGSLQFRTWLLPLLGAGGIIASSFFLQQAGLPVWGRIPVSALIYAPFVLIEIRKLLK